MKYSSSGLDITLHRYKQAPGYPFILDKDIDK